MRSRSSVAASRATSSWARRSLKASALVLRTLMNSTPSVTTCRASTMTPSASLPWTRPAPTTTARLPTMLHTAAAGGSVNPYTTTV
jgi:hypothetical protein